MTSIFKNILYSGIGIIICMGIMFLDIMSPVIAFIIFGGIWYWLSVLLFLRNLYEKVSKFWLSFLFVFQIFNIVFSTYNAWLIVGYMDKAIMMEEYYTNKIPLFCISMYLIFHSLNFLLYMLIPRKDSVNVEQNQ